MEKVYRTEGFVCQIFDWYDCDHVPDAHFFISIVVIHGEKKNSTWAKGKEKNEYESLCSLSLISA